MDTSKYRRLRGTYTCAACQFTGSSIFRVPLVDPPATVEVACGKCSHPGKPVMVTMDVASAVELP